jgi:hypothetical protein
MKVKRQQFKELVRCIIKETIQELMASSQLSSQQPSVNDYQNQMDTLNDPSRPPMDSMTPIEKIKQRREQEKARKDALRAREAEMKKLKADMEMDKKKMDQDKRFKYPTLNKQIQALKGGNASTVY